MNGEIFSQQTQHCLAPEGEVGEGDAGGADVALPAAPGHTVQPVHVDPVTA